MLWLNQFIFGEFITWLISAIICLIVYKLSKFYLKVWNLPPGPFPLPVVGNILFFRGTTCHWTDAMSKLPERYGPVFTLWMGTEPKIFITDIDIAREAYGKSELAGRTQENIYLDGLMCNNDYSDIIFADYGHRWEALRRVTHSAVHKYAMTERLIDVVVDCVDHAVDTMLKREGLNKQFVPFDYIYVLFLNIISSSAFGKRYDIDDPEYKSFKYISGEFFNEINENMILWQFFPILRDNKKIFDFRKKFMDNIEMLRNKYHDHCADYSDGVVRDFCDTLIAAKNEGLREGKESAPYLTDANLSMVIFDLFLGGSDTTQAVFKWILLYILFDKDIQTKLRQEIETEIGDRMPTHEDSTRCHYAMAFIAEALRHRNVAPIGQHKATVDTEIGNWSVEKGMEVIVFQHHILHDDKYWTDGQVFRPERFLEDGKYVSIKPKAYIPFGVGRRVCLGEKMAIKDLFLVLVRLLQKTRDYDIVLHMENKTLDIEENNVRDIHPKEFRISFKPKSKLNLN